MHYTLREYGYLGTQGKNQGLDYVWVPAPTFQQFKELALSQNEGEAALLMLKNKDGQECLQVVNYVGLLQTPDGSQLEILPKTTNGETVVDEARELLWRMLRVVHDLRSRETSEATLATLPNAWLEALITLVLREISGLVRKGIRRQYIRQNEVSTFLKGKLRVAAQMRSRPGKDHHFAVSYEQYLPDRPENRLLKTCLLKLARWTDQFENKRLSRELLFVFDEIPACRNPSDDLKHWSTERGMVYYQPLLPWVRLILADRSPVFSKGGHQGISLLFPMEKLFEDYVAKLLKRKLQFGYRLRVQPCDKYLVKHRTRPWFNLKPDLMVQEGERRVAILDTKWKLLDETGKDKYGLSQPDMYQLFAYGKKYFEGEGAGELFLIYPKHTGFTAPLPLFEFDDDLKLRVVPFELNEGVIVYNEYKPEWLRGATVTS